MPYLNAFKQECKDSSKLLKPLGSGDSEKHKNIFFLIRVHVLKDVTTDRSCYMYVSNIIVSLNIYILYLFSLELTSHLFCYI